MTPWLIGLALALTGCADKDAAGDSAAPGRPGPASALVFEGERPRNLLMISLDTVRVDRLGWVAGTDTTPALDRWLAQGVNLSDHRSCSNWTYASMLCVMAGARGVELGFVPAALDGPPDALPDAVELLAESLVDAGWATRLISSNTYLSAPVNTTGGFQEAIFDPDLRAADINGLALGALSELTAADRPWFLHLHYIDPHAPYDPPAEHVTEALHEDLPWDLRDFIGMNEALGSFDTLDAETRDAVMADILALYDGELRYLDAQLDALLSELPAALLAETLIVLVSDHGEQFMERGAVGHTLDLYREEADAAAAFLSPGNLAPGTWDGPTTHADLAPTVLDALGVPAPAGFTGALLGDAAEDRARMMLEYDGADTIQAVERGGVKLLHRWDSGDFELYRLDADPGEASDVYAEDDPDAAELRALIEAEVQALEALFPGYSPAE